jgi:DNA recombination protein RmuC
VELTTSLPLVLLLLAGLTILGWFFLCRMRALLRATQNDQAWLLMQQQIDQLRLQFGQVLDNSTQLIQQQLGQMIGHVNERLRENSEILQQTHQSVGKDIASLQEILRSPKLRGGLGEFFLEDLLAQILPPQHFATQYCFRSGEKVDAVIKLGSSLVPVDSKFPLENFKRIIDATVDEDQARAKRQFAGDVRKHIDAIATKYILPDEGTYDFALMYIPAENVYYEIIIKDDSTEEKSLSYYAMSKRVVPVSPNSFYAYLQAIVLGLKGMTIEQGAKEIIECLSRLQGDFTRFRDEFGLLGKHLGHAQSSYQSAEKRVEQFGQKLVSANAGQTQPLQTAAADRKLV